MLGKAEWGEMEYLSSKQGLACLLSRVFSVSQFNGKGEAELLTPRGTSSQ